MILRSKATKRVSSLLSGVALLPSSGEWVYSTTPTEFRSQTGEVKYMNTLPDPNAVGDQRREETNMELSMDGLQSVLPEVKWISLITSWFGSDLRLGECQIKPKGEQFQFYGLGGLGGTIELDKDIGPWAVGADGVTERTLYDLDQSTVFMNRIKDSGSDVQLTYNWSTTAGTNTTINATLKFYSDDAGTVFISEHSYPETSVTQGTASPMSGTFTDTPIDIPSNTQSIAVEITRSTSGSFTDVAADRQLDIFVQATAPELTIDSGPTTPYPYVVNGLSRQEMGVSSIFWETPTEYNPVYVQWLNGRNGASVTTQYDTTVDPDPSIGQPYSDPGGFENQSAGVVLIDYAGGTNQEAYSSWNHADTSTGGPGGPIPTGTYRYRTFVWSPVARNFTPFARKGGVGSDILVAPEDKWVPAKSWTELTLDFGTDETFSYVEFVLDQDDTDAEWFYTTNTTIFNLETPRVSYGGTPSDRSVVEGIEDMKSRGYNVMFYPFILMDITSQQALPDPDGAGVQGAYPWRGRIRPMASDQGTPVVSDNMDAFFGECKPSDFQPDYTNKTVNYTGPEEWGLRRFTLHYAFLCAVAGGVDAFCIATEMVGMTEARDGDISFPAINKLKALAAELKNILGENCEITYACDWSEFMPRNYSTSGGFNSIFHLDPLWADPNIDFIGIDNYLPLSDWRGSELAADDALWESIYNLGYLQSQIEGGERYDYQYLTKFDRDNQVRTPITEWRYRDKAHKDWWRNFHFDIVDGVQNSTNTAYVPQLKRIVYTEYGCAAVDKGTNQPNKFLDPKSAESTLPYYSDGSTDVRMQKVYYQAMGEYWNPEAGNNPTSILTDDTCIDYNMMFAWTWDARPWPAFPRLLDVWADGENYSTGHWLQGRQWIEKN